MVKSAKASASSVGEPHRTSPGNVSKRTRNSYHKATDEWAMVEKRADSDEMKSNIASIVMALKKDPRKIKGCMRATLSNFFLRNMHDGDRFPEYLYLHRIPQDFAKPFLYCLNKQLSDDVVKHMKRADRQIVLKMLYYALQLDSGDAFGPNSKKQWTRLNYQRAMDLHNPLADLRWDREFKVNWVETGYYDLLSKQPGGENSGDVIFIHIRLRKTIEAFGCKRA